MPCTNYKVKVGWAIELLKVEDADCVEQLYQPHMRSLSCETCRILKSSKCSCTAGWLKAGI